MSGQTDLGKTWRSTQTQRVYLLRIDKVFLSKSTPLLPMATRALVPLKLTSTAVLEQSSRMSVTAISCVDGVSALDRR